MEATRELVVQNMEESQAAQKRWYDKKAREMNLKTGDKVLVLLPTSTHKLLAQWQGPYIVRKRIGKVNYEVVMPERRKPHVVFHANMLKKWSEAEPTEPEDPQDSALSIEETETRGTEEPDIPLWRDTETDDTLGQPELPVDPEKKSQVEKLWRDFSDTISDNPGRTRLIQHRIPTNPDGKPVRQQPYRIPRAYRDEVHKDLQEMLEVGIIEPSSSEWASPIVVVKKKDGKARICVDYRRLNAITLKDAYPMPRIEDIFDDIGQSKYLTTLDLAKGYWQVPVAEEDKEKTAFITPTGLYQFRVMPFGLCGAPATFQRLMDVVVRELPFAKAYLDDLVIFSQTWQEHMEHLRFVFQCIKEAGLTVKLRKCQFGMHLLGPRHWPRSD